MGEGLFALVGISSLAGLTIASTTPAKWTLEVMASTETEPGAVALKLHDGPITFLVTCDRSESRPWAIAINKTDENFDGIPMFRAATTKFDRKSSNTTEWAYMGTMAFPDYDASKLLPSIANSRKLSIRLQRTNGSKLEISLDLSGSSAQIKELKSACLRMGIRS